MDHKSGVQIVERGGQCRGERVKLYTGKMRGGGNGGGNGGWTRLQIKQSQYLNNYLIAPPNGKIESHYFL